MNKPPTHVWNGVTHEAMSRAEIRAGNFSPEVKVAMEHFWKTATR